MSDLSGPEHLVREAYARGAWVDLRSPDDASGSSAEGSRWGAGRTIRAEAIVRLLADAAENPAVGRAGIRVRGGRVTGCLDLTAVTVPPLVFEFCHFDQDIRLAESIARSVRVVDCWAAGFDGTRMRVDGILDLSRCFIAGALSLCQARVIGQLSLAGLRVGAGGVAVAADGLSVDGGVSCAGLTASGAVRMDDAQITGSLDLENARITCPGPKALSLGNTRIGARLIGRGMKVEGETVLHDADVGRVEFGGAELRHPAGLALSAGGLTVRGGMFCTRGFTASGTMWMVGARISANLALRGAALSNPGKIALNVDRAAIGDCDASQLTCSGQVSLVATHIANMLNLAGAELDGRASHAALTADGAIVDGTLRLDNVRVLGRTEMRTIRVGQRLMLDGGHLEDPSGNALVMPGAEVASDMSCRKAAFAGQLTLTGTRIGGHFDLSQATITGHQGKALNARVLRTGELTLQPAEPIDGTVDLSHAHADVLRDDPRTWPSQLNLDGLTYLALEPRLPARQRLAWLARHPDGHVPQPYEQLAACYSRTGQPQQARRVMYARERADRATMHPLARTWSWLQDITVGYGYQPWRALAWLAVLLAAGSILFTAAPPSPLAPGQAPHFNPIIYTLDLLLPLVGLGQKNAYNPPGAEQWISYALTGAGWILVTTIAAGAARILSRK